MRRGDLDSYHIDFEPIGRRGQFGSDQSFLDIARQLGIDLISFCGGKATCGRCKIQILEGDTTQPTSAERKMLTPAELSAGYRLACVTFPRSNDRVRVPPESLSTPMRTQVEGLDVQVEVEPAVRTATVQLQSPSLSHQGADAESLLQALAQQTDLPADRFDIDVLQQLSPRLREWDWLCQAHVRYGEVVGVSSTGSRAAGLAVDLGSTKIAGYLVDLQTGETLASRGIMNPQISYGEDIVSRITYAKKSPEAARKMQQLLVDGLNEMAVQLCVQTGVSREHILEAVIVGNTAMHHLLLALPVAQLASAPFVPAVISDLDVKGRDIGLHMAPGAYIHLLPNVAGYVGADHVAMLLATAKEWSGKTALALDIGTNTEISLITAAGEMRSLSCASGPAFEGYHIKDGTRARPGAIESVRITADEVLYGTIGDRPATGICGSGILDAVAQLEMAGVLNPAGRIQLGSHARVREVNGEREFVLAPANPEVGLPGITVTQDDVREIQLAKGSIQTGIEVLLRESHVPMGDVSAVIIAGAFGSFIDVANAVAMGMLPDLPLDRFQQVGNAAGIGAKMALLSTTMRAQARALRDRTHYIELATYPDFSRLFARNCQIKPFEG